jgi:phage tail-like protein
MLMDVNGARFWSISTARDWQLAKRGAQGLYLCPKGGVLRLAGAALLAEDRATALALADMPSAVVDDDGILVHWSARAEGGFVASGEGLADRVLPDLAADAGTPVDLALDQDGVLYIARKDGSVEIADTRGRWRVPRIVRHDRLRAGRLAPREGGGVFVLDTASGGVGVVTGRPAREGAQPVNTGIFQRDETNLAPPRLRLAARNTLPQGWRGVAIAARGTRIAVLAHSPLPTEPAAVFLLDAGLLRPAFRTGGLTSPFDMAWLDDETLAMLATGGAGAPQQVPVYTVPPEGLQARGAMDRQALWPVAPPSRVLLARVRAAGAGFINAPMPATAYAVDNGDGALEALTLRALSGAVLQRRGEVVLGPFDAGQSGAVWHRLTVEAVIPERTSVRIDIHADDATGTTPDESKWQAHVIAGKPEDVPPGSPRAGWLDHPSELPHHPGLLKRPREPERSGLFSVLLQRTDGAVRRITGRYCWIRLKLTGDTRITPEIAGLRVHVDRFSYRDKYLPALYHEKRYGTDAESPGNDATGEDFLERMLALFEEPLTLIEGQVANAHLLTDAASAPDTALPWLGQWVGVDVGKGPVTGRSRQMLVAAPFTARLCGTLGGLSAALELATGGIVVRGGRIRTEGKPPETGKPGLAEIDGVTTKVLVLAAPAPGSGDMPAVLAGGSVTSGDIVIIEGFRLRRSMATILGANLGSEDDPLMAGTVRSGNSIVGDTLVLGDGAGREFLALFGAQALLGDADRDAVAAFLDHLAHTVLVLVHPSAMTERSALIAATAREHAPAHVQVMVHPAREALIIGLASLAGIDTFLGRRTKPRPVRQDITYVGRGDRVRDGALREAMDPAEATVRSMAAGAPFTLSGGHGLPQEFIWQWR